MKTQEKAIYGVICVVVHDDGEILLLKRSADKKVFPNKWAVVAGGPLPADFDFKIFAIKEVKAEAGLDGEIFKDLGKVDLKIDGRIWPTYIYAARVTSKEVKLNDEHTEFKWVKPEELGNYDLIPRLAEVIEKVLLK